MLALIARFILNLLASAIGLIAASLLLSGFHINGVSFVVAVLIFSITTTLIGPFISKVALTSAPFLMGGTALVTTLIGLIVAALLTSGISVDGITTWILATLIVWIFTIIGSVVLPLFLFKKWLGNDKKGGSSTPPPAPVA